MAEPRGLLFVELNLSSTNTRDKELQRARALSHAAKTSHPRNRPGEPKSAAKGRLVGDIDGPWRPPGEQGDTAVDGDGPNYRQNRARRKKPYDIHRWRMIQGQSTTRACEGSLPGEQPNRHPPWRTIEMTIPTHKGNSDPFNCTPVPCSALNFSLIQDDRTSLVDIVWPGEISLRKNRASMINEIWKVMPSILDAPPITHAIISHSHYSKAIRYQILGKRDQHATALAEKHKAWAVRGLRDLLEEYQKSGRPELLTQIRATSAQLAACGVISGDVESAQLHFTGVRMAVDLMGGLKSMLPLQCEALVYSQVASAWFNLQRPAFHPDGWDPGAWSEYRTTLPEASMIPPTDPATCGVSSPSPHVYDELYPSTVSPRLRILLDELRELLDVEAIKLALGATQDELSAQVFRWSGLRKLAIRARVLCLLCDLKDSLVIQAQTAPPVEEERTSDVEFCILNESAPTAFNIIMCLVLRTFDRAVFEEHYYADLELQSFRFSSMFLAQIAGHLQRLDPPFPHYDDVDADEDEDEGLRHALNNDKRRFDMLWIYSLGAYIEDCHINPIARRPSAAAESMVSPAVAATQTSEHNQQRRDVHPHSDTSTSSESTVAGGAVQSPHGPFAMRFKNLAPLLGFQSFEDVTDFLSDRYLYCRRLQAASLRKLM